MLAREFDPVNTIKNRKFNTTNTYLTINTYLYVQAAYDEIHLLPFLYELMKNPGLDSTDRLWLFKNFGFKLHDYIAYEAFINILNLFSEGDDRKLFLNLFPTKKLRELIIDGLDTEEHAEEIILDKELMKYIIYDENSLISCLDRFAQYRKKIISVFLNTEIFNKFIDDCLEGIIIDADSDYCNDIYDVVSGEALAKGIRKIKHPSRKVLFLNRVLNFHPDKRYEIFNNIYPHSIEGLDFATGPMLFGFLKQFSNAAERGNVLNKIMSNLYAIKPEIFLSLVGIIFGLEKADRVEFCGDHFIFMLLKSPAILLELHCKDLKGIYMNLRHATRATHEHDLNRMIKLVKDRLNDLQYHRNDLDKLKLVNDIFNELTEEIEKEHIAQYTEWSGRIYNFFTSDKLESYKYTLNTYTDDHHYKRLLLVTLNLIYTKFGKELTPNKKLPYDREKLKQIAAGVDTQERYQFIIDRWFKVIAQPVKLEQPEVEAIELDDLREINARRQSLRRSLIG